jgi:hypothetical protein
MRQRLAFLLMAVPLPAVASGSEVLASLWSELALLAAVVVSLFVTRISFRSKAFVFAIYLLSVIAVSWVTWDWPYRKNQALIMSMSLIVPGLCWLVALAVARYRYRANITSRSGHDAAKAARP